MRYKQPYSLYTRKMKNGKSVYYYRTYDENGKRTSGRSTGQTTKTAAHAYLSRLIEKGELLPKKEKTFYDFAKDWWIPGKCQYLRKKTASGKDLSPTYVANSRILLTKHILPFFGKMYLTRISTNDIENWIIHLKDNAKLSDSTLKNCYSLLRLMLNEAERLDMIYKNPFKKAMKIVVQRAEKGIFTIEEYGKLFDEKNIPLLWKDNLIHYTASLLAASGGLRLGEVQALQNKGVFDHYVFIEHNYCRISGLKSTKNREVRYVPVPEKTNRYLHIIKGSDPEGFVFSVDGGKNPLKYRSIEHFFYRTLERLGISEEERKARNLTFHSHRHFFTTVLRKQIPDSKLRLVIGHKSADMINRYDHPTFDLEEYQDVLKVQESYFT